MKKYKIIDNFLNSLDCKNLINDAENIFDKIGSRQILNNNRELTQSTSIKFKTLLKNSKVWKDFNQKISSQEFFDKCMHDLKDYENKFSITSFFSPNAISSQHEKYKELQLKKVGFLSSFSLLKILSFRFYLFLKRILKYKFTNKNYVELIYDYSKAQNGYKREIHRDSDARTLIFLIYLNNLSQEATGGSLLIHEYINKNKRNIPPQPSSKDCKLIEKIKPKEGRMVIFLNSDDSFHSVEEMINHNDYRYFIYGSFTLLGKKNPLLKNRFKKFKTEFHLFD
jgi:hypothetical protein